MSRDVDQAGNVKMRFELHAGKEATGIGVELLDLCLDALDGGEHGFVLAHEDNAHGFVFFILNDDVSIRRAHELAVLIPPRPPQTYLAEPGLMADDDPQRF